MFNTMPSNKPVRIFYVSAKVNAALMVAAKLCMSIIFTYSGTVYAQPTAVGQTDVMLVWHDRSDDLNRINISRRIDGQWQPAETIAVRSNPVTTPMLGRLSNGHLAVVWSERVGRQVDLLMSEQPNDGAPWSPPRQLFAAGGWNLNPILHSVNRELSVLAWDSSLTGNTDIYFMRHQDGVWSEPERLSASNSNPDIKPSFEVDTNSALWIRWSQFDRRSAQYIDQRTRLDFDVTSLSAGRLRGEPRPLVSDSQIELTESELPQRVFEHASKGGKKESQFNAAPQLVGVFYPFNRRLQSERREYQR